MPERRRLLAAGLALGLCLGWGAPGAQAQAGSEEPDYARIGRFIYAFHRVVARSALDDPALADLPPELGQRARLLALRYDAVIERKAVDSDADIRALLREASQVGQAMLSARSSASPDSRRPRSPS